MQEKGSEVAKVGQYISGIESLARKGIKNIINVMLKFFFFKHCF